MPQDPNEWMWQKATDLLERADRTRARSYEGRPRRALWQPAADLFESRDALMIVVALPGVEPGQVDVLLERGDLIVRGERRLPERCTRGGEVRRLEIPHGRFERSLRLPSGRYELRRNELVHGCLFLELGKLADE